MIASAELTYSLFPQTSIQGMDYSSAEIGYCECAEYLFRYVLKQRCNKKIDNAAFAELIEKYVRHGNGKLSWRDDFDKVINTIRKKSNDVAHPGDKAIRFSDVEEMRAIHLGPFQHKEFPDGVIAYFNDLLS